MKKNLLLSLLTLFISVGIFAQGGGNTFDQFMGTNGFIDDPVEKLSALGNVREYHPWGFTVPDYYSSDEYVGNGDDVEYEYDRWSSYWDFDQYYTDMKAAGITVIPALWLNAPWMDYENEFYRPVDDWNGSHVDPENYRQKAEFHWQYAARYGAVTHADVDLKVKLSSLNQKRSGLDLLSYYEDWNEQDRTWNGVGAEFLPAQYAAMASAVVDGHDGTMTGNVGLKNADPNAKFVMGGLAGLGTDYVIGMKTWFDANRPQGDWPIDVINMHHYCNEGGDQAGGWWTNGECPEENGLKTKVFDVMTWIDANVPGTELWLSEWGYDVNQASDNRIIAFAGKDVYTIFSEWTLRTYLMLSSTGIQRCQQFMLRDVYEESAGTTRFNTSGMVTCPDCADGGHVPKPAWYDVYALKNALTGYIYESAVAETTSLHVYKYHNATSGVDAYVLWSPTGDGSTVDDYQLSVGAETEGYSVNFIGQTIHGAKSAVAISGGTVSVDVTEMPTVIILDTPNFDTEAPSVPGNLTVTEVGILLRVAWEASTDNVAVDKYEVYVNGVLRTSSTDLYYNLIGQSTAVSFTIEVYAVDAEGNKSVAATYVNTATGIENLLEGSIQLFPNPSDGKFTISIPINAVMTITNSTGMLILGKQVVAGIQTINLTKLLPGIYYVTFTADAGQTTQKLVIE